MDFGVNKREVNNRVKEQHAGLTEIIEHEEKLTSGERVYLILLDERYLQLISISIRLTACRGNIRL